MVFDDDVIGIEEGFDFFSGFVPFEACFEDFGAGFTADLESTDDFVFTTKPPPFLPADDTEDDFDAPLAATVESS